MPFRDQLQRLDQLRDVNVTEAPAIAGDVLTWDETTHHWIAAAIPAPPPAPPSFVSEAKWDDF